MSLLPQQIPPFTEPIGIVKDGVVFIDKTYWLFLYNIALNTLGTGSGLPADALQDIASTDTDAADSDAISLRRFIENLNVLLPTEPTPSPSDLPDVGRALVLAQDDLLPDPAPQAQPIQSIVVGASPFTYTAPFNGAVTVTGGTVSGISITRQTITLSTGITVGLIPVSRLDQVQVTYTGTPTMNFLPT